MNPNAPRKELCDFDHITEENAKYFTKLIFFKVKKSDVRWHICLPEMTDLHGFKGFCGVRTWSEVDTQNRQRVEQMMQAERTDWCDRCAEEFTIAFRELLRQGYLTNDNA